MKAIRCVAVLLVVALMLLWPKPQAIQSDTQSLSDWVIAFEPSGTHIRDGHLKIRLDFYPSEGSKCYDQHHVYVVDETSPEWLMGYTGEIDKEGNPVNSDNYQKWLDSLPHIWRVNPALCHFITVSPDITASDLDNIIKSYFDADVVATIDNAVSQSNSAHLISPYMRDKTVTTSTKVQAGQDETALVNAVNARLAGYEIEGETRGVSKDIKEQSIDIGEPAVNHLQPQYVYGKTVVILGNPANADGTLDTVQVYAKEPFANFRPGTFSLVSGTTFQCRDSEGNLGSVPASTTTTFTGLSISVVTGDCIGMYTSAAYARLACNDWGGAGIRYISGEYIDPGEQADFSSVWAGYIGSLYGTGTEGGVTVPTVTTQAATNVSYTSCTGNGNITDTGGENCATRGFCYMVGTSGDPTTANSMVYESGSFSTGSFTKTITGLSPNTGYRMRAYAVNSAGTSYGTTMQVTTLDIYSEENEIIIEYDWLSRKIDMYDPDMGHWHYDYDNNGNLITQTDAKGQSITMTYDALNRLITKTYSTANMTNVSYTYDSITGGNYGKGQRTGMSDAIGDTAYKYDTRGRMVSENRTIDSVSYVTSFTYDGVDRIVTTTYPTNEVVTQNYNGRGLPNTLYGTVALNLVTSTSYNALGLPTQINLGNGLQTTYAYWGIDHGTDSYGRLWEIKTQYGTNPPLQDIQHTWDPGGNLSNRYDVRTNDIENFTYDFLDRLLGVSGNYTDYWQYNQIGNIVSHNGTSYSYVGYGPHAVSGVGSTGYVYDANGNMTTRGAQTITWDAENRPITVSGNGTTTTFVYDGDGNRVKKQVNNGQPVITIYVNKYFEVTGSENTSNYYHGGQLVAMKVGTALQYVHQDHLTGTSFTTNSSGNTLGTIKYFPFGYMRNATGDLGTDKKFTGQRLDSTGLYYYNARYYDPQIGRFISPDSIIPNPANPQSFNRYSYCLNNPLKYVDPSGHFDQEEIKGMGISKDDIPETIYELLRDAQLNDRLVVSYKDGSTKEFNFAHDNQYLGWDPGAGVGVTNNEGKFVNIRDKLGDENITDIARYSKRDLTIIHKLDPDIARSEKIMHPRMFEPYRFEKYYWIGGEEALLPILLADICYGLGDVLEFLGPGLDQVPSEYLLVAAGLAGLAGPQAVFAVLLYYGVVSWGPDVLREAGDFFNDQK